MAPSINNGPLGEALEYRCVRCGYKTLEPTADRKKEIEGRNYDSKRI